MVDANSSLTKVGKGRDFPERARKESAVTSFAVSPHMPNNGSSASTNINRTASPLTKAEPTKTKKKRVVRFGEIEIREYPFRLGDNPAVSSGPPLTIDWKHYEDTVIVTFVDKYESARPERRHKLEMAIPRSIREDWLRNAGHSRSEIQQAIVQSARDRIRRHKLAKRHCIAGSKLEEAAESLGRKFTRLVLRRKKDDALYKHWIKEMRHSEEGQSDDSSCFGESEEEDDEDDTDEAEIDEIEEEPDEPIMIDTVHPKRNSLVVPGIEGLQKTPSIVGFRARAA